jgi:hypothetical protein
VALLAYGVGLAQPLVDPIVEFVQRFDPELVDMISWRDRLDSTKPRVLQAAGEDDVAIEPSLVTGPHVRAILAKRR